jgi:hypothetical protein
LSSLNDELPDDLLWDSGNSNGGLSNGSSMDAMGGQQQQQPVSVAGPMMGPGGGMMRNPGMGGPMGNQQNINLVNALNKPKVNGPGGMMGGNPQGGGMGQLPPHSAMNSVGGDVGGLNSMNSNSSLQGGSNQPQVSSMMGGPGLVSMAPVNSMSSEMGGGGGTVVSTMGGMQQMRPQQGMQQVMLNGPMVRHVGMPPMGNNGLQQQIRQPNLIGAAGQPRMINASGVRMQAMVSSRVMKIASFKSTFVSFNL